MNTSLSVRRAHTATQQVAILDTLNMAIILSMEIGVAELRNGLSKRLADVQAGRTVTVTDHGKAIARIIPIDQPTRLEQLIAEGLVRVPAKRQRTVPHPIPESVVSGTVSDLIKDQRR